MKRSLFVVLSLCVLITGCGNGGGDSPQATGSKPVVYTTFYPTTYFASRIGGELIEVVCPVPADEDAIFWQPSPEVIQKYQEADLIVVNGAEFEKWVATASLPLARVVDTAKPFEEDFVRFEGGITHAHGPAGAHAHEGIDGHTWVDPLLAKLQAAEIAQALVKLLPEHRAEIERNTQALQADLDELDAALKKLTADYEGELILASHPAYNYLQKRYDLNIINLDLDPESMPDDETMAALKKAQAEHPARYILWEGEPLPEIRDRFATELGLTSVLFSPAELMDPEELAAGADYMSVMRENVARLGPVLSGAGD
jgi:zinc transport system substrate-binding protein